MSKIRHRDTFVQPPRPSADALEILAGLGLVVLMFGLLYGGFALIAALSSFLVAS